MRCILQASLTTFAIMLYEVFWAKQARSPLIYIGFFLVLLFLSIIQSQLWAKEPAVYKCTLTEEQRDYYFWKVHTHYMEAHFLSNVADRWLYTLNGKLAEKEYHISSSAILAISTSAFTKSVQAGVIAACISLLEKYLHEFKDVFEEIRNCLYRVGYHVEMAEFYQDLLAADGG